MSRIPRCAYGGFVMHPVRSLSAAPSWSRAKIDVRVPCPRVRLSLLNTPSSSGPVCFAMRPKHEARAAHPSLSLSSHKARFALPRPIPPPYKHALPVSP
ncbi:hypothetical protein C2E23DRAFT_798691 [Lenzites betulinus]|nr:hypothetical protein C2E23DRAFT_798691 [Lenzites betulinus]